MHFEVQPYPEFSWSMARRAVFRECLRKYYFQYYGSHNGWVDEAPELARCAYRLKKLTTLELLAGKALHEKFAKSILDARGGMPLPTVEEIVQPVSDILNKAYAESKDRRRFEMQPKSIVMLHEFYYGSQPSRDKIDRINNRIRKCAHNFLQSTSFREAAHSPRVYVKGADNTFDFFLLNGIKVYAAPDLLYKSSTDEYCIVDWKTGSVDPAVRDQLLTYSIYLLQQGYYNREAIKAKVEYLEQEKCEAFALSHADVQRHRGFVMDSVGRMQQFLEDIHSNVPKPMDTFPLREDRTACNYCNYKEICVDDESRPLDGPFG